LKNLLSLISNIVLLLGAFFSGYVVNMYGRKKILLVGTTLTGIFLAILAILSIIDSDSLSFLSVVCIFAYYLSFNFSLGPIVWLYCSEILPSKGISIAAMFNWAGASIIVFMLPYISLSILFVGYTSVCVAGIFFMITFMKETKDKTKA
jgi:MFS family permease